MVFDILSPKSTLLKDDVVYKNPLLKFTPKNDVKIKIYDVCFR